MCYACTLCNVQLCRNRAEIYGMTADEEEEAYRTGEDDEFTGFTAYCAQCGNTYCREHFQLFKEKYGVTDDENNECKLLMCNSKGCKVSDNPIPEQKQKTKPRKINRKN